MSAWVLEVPDLNTKDTALRVVARHADSLPTATPLSYLLTLQGYCVGLCRILRRLKYPTHRPLRMPRQSPGWLH
jgi:hypothetical protein